MGIMVTGNNVNECKLALTTILVLVAYSKNTKLSSHNIIYEVTIIKGIGSTDPIGSGL